CFVAAAIGGAMCAAIAAPAARDATGASESYIFRDDPDTLASMPDSLVIRYDGLRRLLLKRYPADYELVIDFLDEAGKKDRLRLQLKPPDNVEASARAAGVSGKTVMKNYAAETQASILRALPQTIATRAEWKFLTGWQLTVRPTRVEPKRARLRAENGGTTGAVPVG